MNNIQYLLSEGRDDDNYYFNAEGLVEMYNLKIKKHRLVDIFELVRRDIQNQETPMNKIRYYDLFCKSLNASPKLFYSIVICIKNERITFEDLSEFALCYMDDFKVLNKPETSIDWYGKEILSIIHALYEYSKFDLNDLSPYKVIVFNIAGYIKKVRSD